MANDDGWMGDFRTYRVTLDIKIDLALNDPPWEWDWLTLLDLSGGENVEVINIEDFNDGDGYGNS